MLKRVISGILAISMLPVMNISFAQTDEVQNEKAVSEAFAELKDPMHMSDEELFGAWDEEEGIWTVEPILRYDAYEEELAKVKEAAKEGNYDNAKSELLGYYRLKDDDEIYCYEPASDYSIYADAMNDKIWTYQDNDKFIGQAYIGTEWDWYSIDISGTASSGFGTYWLLDADMDGTMLEIASKENENGYGAYVEVIMNGVRETYPVIADTYISAGENTDANYGSEPILYCREASENEMMPISADTARPYFRFDLGNTLNADSIKLNFYGHSTGEQVKKIYCATSNNGKNFEENSFTWNKTPAEAFNFKQTGYVWLDSYHPEKVNEHMNAWNTEYEWLNYSARLYQTQWLIQAYLLNGNTDYIYKALEFAIEQYRMQPSCQYPRPLDSGWRIQNLVRAIYTTIDSDYMTPEVFCALLKYVYAHINELKDVTLTVTNQNSAVKVNVARICAFFPEITKDEWWEQSKTDLHRFYSGTLLNEDGSYTESCVNYISGVISEFIDAIKMIKAREGEDDEYYLFFMDQLHKLTTYYMTLAASNGKAFPYGDGARSNLRGSIEEYNKILDDNDLRYFATAGDKGKEPEYTTRLYPEKAICMMRSGWEEDDMCAFLNNDNGGTHGHNDELALDVSAYNTYLLVDAGVSSYSEASEFSSTRAKTLNHNTIMIDNKDQAHLKDDEPGYMELKANDSFDFLHAATDKAYTGFNMHRKVLFLKNKYIIVSDFIEAPENEEHTYSVLWHPDYNENLVLDENTNAAQTTYKSQPNIKIIPADTSSDAEVFDRMMFTPSYGEVYSRSVRYDKENVSGNQNFDTVLYPENIGINNDVSVTRIALDCDTTTATALEVKINDNKAYYYSSNEETPSKRAFADYVYDGEMAYVEANGDGEEKYVAFTNGSLLALSDNEVIIRSDKKLKDIAASYESSRLKLYSSEMLDGKIYVASEKEYKTVYFNDKEVEFEYSEGYIITDGSEKKEESGSIRPGSPSGGGGGGGGGAAIKNATPEPTETPEPTITPEPTAVPDTQKELPFKDCENHWAKDFIEALYNADIVNGTDDDRFEPDSPITRAQCAKILAMVCGLDTKQAKDSSFTDIDGNEWYAPYVNAVFKADIVSGYEDNTFKPDKNITRQELAKMLCLAAEVLGIVPDTKNEITYSDADLIAEWAVEYVEKAAMLGLFGGDENNRFNPSQNATRAAVAAVVYRLIDDLEEGDSND